MPGPVTSPFSEASVDIAAVRECAAHSLSPTYGLRRHHIPFSETRPQVARALERSGHKLDVRVRVPYLSPVGLMSPIQI